MPMAWRRSDRTITILVKEVSIIRIAGANDKTVNKRNIWRITATSPGSSALFMPIFKEGALKVNGSARQI